MAKRTSKKVAAKAAEALQDTDSSQREKSLAGSVLAQTEPEPQEHRSHRRHGSLKVPGERWPERQRLKAAE